MPKVRFDTKQTRAQAAERQREERKEAFRTIFQAEAAKQMKMMGVKKKDLGPMVGKKRATGYDWIDRPERLSPEKMGLIFSVLRFTDDQRKRVLEAM